MSLTAIDDAIFDREVTMSSKPVLVFYWADWAESAYEMSVNLTELSEQFADSVKFVSLDTDINVRVPVRFGIMKLPGIHLFLNGDIVEQFYGPQPKKVLTDLINKTLEKAKR